MTLAHRIVDFYRQLQPPAIPAGVQLLYPQQDPVVMSIVEEFFLKFYNDEAPRRLIFGINPGRFGAGATGVNFTASRQLTDHCRIEHSLKPQSELSAEFIYEMVSAFGGPFRFYQHYFITSVCPLGFVRNGVNLNYYDDPELKERVTPFIVRSIHRQLSLGFLTDKCFCIGEDKNLKFLSALNREHGFFDTIIPLPHPRFIMQYRRRNKQAYIDQYLKALALAN